MIPGAAIWYMWCHRHIHKVKSPSKNQFYLKSGFEVIISLDFLSNDFC